MSGSTVVHAGFVPLTDCAPLVVARELGFDVANGFTFQLHRQASWANIRDKVEADLLDCAIMLAPMPLASTLGLGGRPNTPLIAPMATSLNGNGITLSRALFEEMMVADPVSAAQGGMAAAQALARVVAQRSAQGTEPLTLGIVHPFSCHNYDLRYWLASAGVDPDHDANLVVVPPPLTAVNLKAGRIDGFCVGMPWNGVAVDQGHGVIIATKPQLWAASPEKVLGLKQTFAEQNSELTLAVIRALSQACMWLDESANRKTIAKTLSEQRYVGIAESILLRALTDDIPRGADFSVPLPQEQLIFHKRHANFPWTSHASWILTQMIRWGQIGTAFDIADIARRVYRPDIYRSAVKHLGVEVPEFDTKCEGGGTFFGSGSFDPTAPVAFLRQFKLRQAHIDLAMFTGDQE